MIECNRATMLAQRSRPVFELVSMKEGKMRTIGVIVLICITSATFVK
jgi:hypothetical protein